MNLLTASLGTLELRERLGNQENVRIGEKRCHQKHMNSSHRTSLKMACVPQRVGTECQSVTPDPCGNNPNASLGIITLAPGNWLWWAPLQTTSEFPTGPGLAITHWRIPGKSMSLAKSYAQLLASGRAWVFISGFLVSIMMESVPSFPNKTIHLEVKEMTMTALSTT